MLTLYWKDAVRWYLKLRDSQPDSDLYWTSLTNHSNQHSDIRDSMTTNPKWDSFDSNRHIAFEVLYREVFRHFATLRLTLLASQDTIPDVEITELAKQGMFVAYYPEFSYSDPAAQAVSGELFNWQTMPPPSLWVFAGRMSIGGRRTSCPSGSTSVR